MSRLGRAAFLAVCVLVAALAAPAVSGQASVETTRVRQEMSGVLPSDCTGELAWSLVFHQLGQLRVDGRSGVHFVGRFNVSDFRAYDPAGNEYTGGHAGQWSFSLNCGEANCEYPVQNTFVSTLTAAGQGSAPNLRIRTLYHFVINANGAMTVSLQIDDVSCSTD